MQQPAISIPFVTVRGQMESVAAELRRQLDRHKVLFGDDAIQAISAEASAEIASRIEALQAGTINLQVDAVTPDRINCTVTASRALPYIELQLEI